MSAYFQKGAGELVGMCWLGRCRVLGGFNFSSTRCGAGVTKDELMSSWRNVDVSVGDRGMTGSGAVPLAEASLVAAPPRMDVLFLALLAAAPLR